MLKLIYFLFKYYKSFLFKLPILLLGENAVFMLFFDDSAFTKHHGSQSMCLSLCCVCVCAKLHNYVHICCLLCVYVVAFRALCSQLKGANKLLELEWHPRDF